MELAKTSLILFILTLLLVAAFFADLLFGSVSIPINEIVKILFSAHHSTTQWDTIIFQLRLPRAITAIFAGAALSVSGLQMQTIFRNPLAVPYVLGISSGATLGVALLMLGFSGSIGFSTYSLTGSWAMCFAAWVGAALVLLLILIVTIRIKHIMTILILGIMFGSAISAVVNILQYFSNETSLKSFVIWTMGSLSGVTLPQLSIFLPAVFIGLIVSAFSVKMLNALLLGENYAKTIGLNLKMSKIFIFVSTSILAGTITAFCGPIGFIGIAVPHIARILFRTADHKILLPATILIGAVLMLLCDVISQLPGSNKVLPINSVTALVGIPIVLWIIIRNRTVVV